MTSEILLKQWKRQKVMRVLNLVNNMVDVEALSLFAGRDSQNRICLLKRCHAMENITELISVVERRLL